MESALGPDAVVPLPGADAAAMAWRLRGQLYLTVIAKASFAFTKDAELVRVGPQPILRGDVYHGNNPSKSVRYTSDIVPYLGRADVLLTGSAYAPPDNPVRSLRVRLALFHGHQPVLDKWLVVQDNREFQRMPLVYERALAGVEGQDNPLGVVAGAGEPNITDPAQPRGPAGFGPIARAWPSRKRLLGGPRKALEGRIAEIPDDFDWSYFQAAPADQRLDALRGDEWLVLEGLHPTLPRLQMRLPGARGRARIHGLSAFGVAEGQPLELRTDTLRIDTEEQCCTLVSRHSFPIAGEAALAAVQIVAGVELPASPLAWPEPPRGHAARLPDAASAAPAASPPPEAPIKLRMLSGTLDLDDEVVRGAAERSPTPFTTAAEDSAHHAQPPPSPSLLRPPGTPVPPPPSPISPWAAGAPREAAEPDKPLAPAPTASLPATSPILPSLSFLDARSGLLLGPSAAAAIAAQADAEVASDRSAAADGTEERVGARPALDLLWFEEKSLPRIRRTPAFRAILDALRDKPLDPDIDDPALELDPAALEARREIFEIFAHGAPLGAEALERAFAGAIRADGRFVPPLVLLAGELVMRFDELDALKATMATVAPLAAGDEHVQAALEAARELLKSPDLLSPRAIVGRLNARIHEAFAQGKHEPPLTYVEAQVERALLEHRRYARRAVLGGRHLCGLLSTAVGASPGIPAYLPESLAEVLPMTPRFRVRVLAEAHLPADPSEAHPMALKIAAIARVEPAPDPTGSATGASPPATPPATPMTRA